MLRLPVFLALLTLLAACLPQPIPGSPIRWVYADLRYAGGSGSPNGELLEPGQDLVAVYTHALASELWFRLDLLDLGVHQDADLYLALDTCPGGTQALPFDLQAEVFWDVLLDIPAAGPIQAQTSEGTIPPNLALRVLRDPLTDTVEISLNRASLPISGFDFRFQVYAVAPGSRSAADSTPPLASDDPPPPQAPVLLAFWNTFPAYTPALALRRWDGAHTGPFGGRHGLYNLLRVARNRGLPLALLDLKTSSLSALEAVHGINRVREMAAAGLLILPDAVPALWQSEAPSLAGETWLKAVEQSRSLSQSYLLPASPFLFTPVPAGMTPGQLPREYRLIFTPDLQINGSASELSPVLRWGEQRVIPILPSALSSGSNNGELDTQISLDLRRALAEAARSSQDPSGSPRILILGGDLPQSAWGDPDFARAAMDWLTSHPWIHVLDAQDLLSAGTLGGFHSPERPAGADLEEGGGLKNLSEEMMAAPPGPLTQAAWQAYLALFSPVSPNPPELPLLRSHYAGQIGVLLSAGRWANHPVPVSDCTQDPDLDRQPECILASDRVYALFELDPAGLSNLFVISEGNVHQVIAPSSQIISGLSDPQNWDFNEGLSADPSVIPGAFFDGFGPYQAELIGDRLQFTSQESGYAKSFSLLPQGIQVEIQSQAPYTVQIPLALDPWTRYLPGWTDIYSGQGTENTWMWGLSGGAQVQVSSSAPLSAYSFLDSQEFMKKVEDPNFEFPPGHFLPFPLSLVEVDGSGTTIIDVRLH